MHSSAVLRQTHQDLIVQFTELQNLRSRVLQAEQRMFGPRRANRRRASGRRLLGRTTGTRR
jgi:hypothetical protein